MIEEVLNRIIETESASEEKKRAAETEAAAIRVKADGECRAITEEKLKNARAAADEVVSAATKAADEAYAREIEAALVECETLVRAKQASAKELTADLLRRLKDGNI